MRIALGSRTHLGAGFTATLAAAALLIAPAHVGAASALSPSQSPSKVTPAAAPGDSDRTYRNPLKPRIPGDGTVDSCADPIVLKGVGDRYWYMYCTTDPLNDEDVDAEGNARFHPIPQMRSRDLVHWRYLGDALPEPPEYAAEGAGLWAPDVVYSKATKRYYMTFVVTETEGLNNCDGGDPDGDGAIGVAVSRNPTGPWRVSDKPVVGPRPDPNVPATDCTFLWTFDPDVLGDRVGQRSVLYYGSYYGGVHATRVEFRPRGMDTLGASTRIAIGNRYEGTNVVKRGDWYWFFGSATNCCNGPLTSYGVFAGRSKSPMGPFVDKDGQSLLVSRVGGTPVLLPNGNRWVGVGHNTVFRDAAGKWWTIYHAADRTDPYFAFDPGFTKRPALLDPLDWVNGWPTVRAGKWASDRRMPAPAIRPGQPSAYRPDPVRPVRLGAMMPAFSDDFEDGLEAAWSWTGGEPEPDSYAVEGGVLRWDTQAGDVARDSNSASLLTRAAPRRGDYAVQTRVRLNVPPDMQIYNYAQAGVFLHRGLDKFIKLVHVSIWETRQTEFAKEVPSAPEEYPLYGNGVVGPPGDLTTLRIVVDRRQNGERYTAYTRRDGDSWVRGGTWTHRLGDAPKIGLGSMGFEGFTARFLDVRTYRLR